MSEYIITSPSKLIWVRASWICAMRFLETNGGQMYVRCYGYNSSTDYFDLGMEDKEMALKWMEEQSFKMSQEEITCIPKKRKIRPEVDE